MIKIVLAIMLGFVSATLVVAQDKTSTDTKAVAYKTERIDGLDKGVLERPVA